MSIFHDNGECIRNTSLTSFSDDEELLPMDIPLYVSNSLLSETRSNSWSSSITISGTNYFTCHWYDWDSYYKPYTVELWYSGSSQPARISASFQTEGELVDTNHNHIEDDYVYSINVAQTLPVSGTHYQTVFPLGNGRTIRYTGQLGSGMWLYFNWRVNSTTYEWTVNAMITPS